MILSKIKIHPFFYIVMLLSLITGNFKNIIIFSSLIFVHELGHIITALICGWEIEKVTLLPFGGITTFNTKINKSIIDEFFVAISGPIFQCLFFMIFKQYLIKEYHISLLVFNLIPIYPLDGYKILKLTLYNVFPFKLTSYLSLLVSFIISIIIIIKNFNLTFILVISLLIHKGIKEYKSINIIFNKFIIERYIYDFKFKRTKTIKKISQMYYNKNHIFKTKNRLVPESQYLHKMFDNH